MKIDVSTSSVELARKVKPGRLFRSGRPERLHDPVTSRDFLVFDLRSPDEVDLSMLDGQYRLWSMLMGDGQKLSYPERYKQLEPGADLGKVVAEDYFRIFLASRSLISEAFELVASDPRYKVWIYCSAGKDRTGIFVALMLRVLGVSMKSIEYDYMRSVEAVRRTTCDLEIERPAYLGLVFPSAASIRYFIEEVESAYGPVHEALWGHGGRGTHTVGLLRAKLLSE